MPLSRVLLALHQGTLMFYRNRIRVICLAVVCGASTTFAYGETVRQALTHAYANNPTILSALLNVKATAEGIALARSAKLPTIAGTAELSGSYSGDGSLGVPTTSVGIGLSQTLFDSFKSDADIEAARALTQASRYSLQNSEQDVLLAAAEAFFEVIEYTQIVKLRQDDVRFYQAQVQSANDRLKIGEGTKLDVSQAQARLAQGTANYQSAIASLQTYQATYERYVGRKPQNLVDGFDVGQLLPKTLDAAIKRAVEDHPAILSAKAAIRASQADSESANAAFGPTLALTSSIGASVYADGVTADPQPSGSLKLNLSIPIYAGGSYGSNIRKANINQIKSEIDALATRDQIKESLITAWSTLQSAVAQITSAASGVASARVSLNGTVQERDVGQATTLDVLNAQSDLTSAQLTLIEATATKAIATFSVVAATGHLTADDLRLPVKTESGEGYIAKVEDAWAELRALD